MPETIWVNAVSDNSVRRAWDLRRALQSRTIASTIVITGDYETTVAIDRREKDRLKNILSTYNHKFIQKNVKRPDSSQAHCGWYVARDYMLFHLNRCERCKELREPFKEIRAEVGQRTQHEVNTINQQNSEAEVSVTKPPQTKKDSDDTPSKHYMKQTVDELERLMEIHIQKATLIEKAKNMKIAEQERVAREQAEKKKIGLPKLEALMKQAIENNKLIEELKKEMGL